MSFWGPCSIIKGLKQVINLILNVTIVKLRKLTTLDGRLFSFCVMYCGVKSCVLCFAANRSAASAAGQHDGSPARAGRHYVTWPAQHAGAP